MDMNRYLSSRVQNIQASPLVSLMNKGKRLRAEGQNVLGFGGGEPDFDTPDRISEAAIRDLKSGDTHYVESLGQDSLRKRIAQKLEEENGIKVDWKTQILVTPGAKMAIFLVLSSILNPGDKVIIFEPAWVTYRQGVEWNGGKVTGVPLSREDHFHITREKLEHAYSPETKAMIVTNPCNPTGRVLTEGEIQTIADFVEEHHILVIADEIYERLVYNGRKHISLGTIDKIRDYVITTNGCSKSFAMPGWRVGYIAAHPDLIRQVLKLVQNTFTCIPGFVSQGAREAFDCKEEVEAMRKEYERRRNYIVASLDQLPHVSCYLPEGAFYIMPHFDLDGMDSFGIANFLLEKCQIMAAPGDVFGSGGEKSVRMSYACSMDMLEEAVARLKKVL